MLILNRLHHDWAHEQSSVFLSLPPSVQLLEERRYFHREEHYPGFGAHWPQRIRLYYSFREIRIRTKKFQIQIHPNLSHKLTLGFKGFEVQEGCSAWVLAHLSSMSFTVKNYCSSLEAVLSWKNFSKIPNLTEKDPSDRAFAHTGRRGLLRLT